MEDALSRIKHKHSRMINGRRHVWDVEKNCGSDPRTCLL